MKSSEAGLKKARLTATLQKDWLRKYTKTKNKTRGPKGHISCTWVQCATFLTDQQGGGAIFVYSSAWKTQTWDLASCQVSLNSFQRFQKEVKNVSANQPPGRPSCFCDRPKNTNLVEDFKILLPVKLHWILFSSFREEVENVSANQRPGWPSCVSDRPEKYKLGREHWDLASCQVSLKSV